VKLFGRFSYGRPTHNYPRLISIIVMIGGKRWLSAQVFDFSLRGVSRSEK